MLNPIVITGTNLPDVWFQTLYKIIEVGRDFTIDEGSFKGQIRKEYDYITIHAKCPGVGELLPKLNPALQLDDPVAQNYLNDYLPYLMTGEEAEGEQYTYGQRIVNDGCNQMDIVIERYKNQGHRNNQLIMQIGKPTDMLLEDPPCLRHIDTRIQDGKLHFYPYFRSWDLWGGLPANLAAIELMKQHMAMEIGVENGEIVACSKGLHLYSYIFEIAELVRGKTSEEFKKEIEL
ncbi:MAG: thymidylate synthase [Deltaproteobacteria bacterium]|nr:MAG: thymidylate synthase [Deltaproteobacteria bacterium]